MNLPSDPNNTDMNTDNLDNLLQTLSDDLDAVSPVRPMRMIALWIGAISIYIAGCIAFFGVRPDFSDRWGIMYQAELLLGLCVIINGGVAAILLAIPAERSHYKLLAIPLIALSLLSVVVLLSGEISMQSLSDSFKMDHLFVTLRLCLLATAPTLWLIITARCAAPTHPAHTCGMIYLAASTAAYLILRLTMPGDNIANVLIWCYLPVIVLGLLGAALGGRLLKW